MRLARSPLLSLLHRAFCAGSAGLIFALGLLAASPQLHEQLHHDFTSAAADQCAVVLFASGVSAPAALSIPLPLESDWRECTFVAPSELALKAPRYALRPERGPPVA